MFSVQFYLRIWLKDPKITEVFFKSQRYRDSLILHISIVWSVSPNLEELAGWTVTAEAKCSL